MDLIHRKNGADVTLGARIGLLIIQFNELFSQHHDWRDCKRRSYDGASQRLCNHLPMSCNFSPISRLLCQFLITCALDSDHRLGHENGTVQDQCGARNPVDITTGNPRPPNIIRSFPSFPSLRRAPTPFFPISLT